MALFKGYFVSAVSQAYAKVLFQVFEVNLPATIVVNYFITKL